MQIKFWGTRGSCPGSINRSSHYGGNSSCLSVKLAHEDILILDAGTGIRNCGNSISGTPEKIHLLLSHLHWDHIQGLPFFAPLFQENREIHIYYPGNDQFKERLFSQMDGIRFPISFSELPSQIHFHTDLSELEKKLNCKVTTIECNHIGECFGYRITQNKKSIVYIPDNQLHKGKPYKHPLRYFVKHCKKTNILIHDSQLLPSDLPFKENWGHSLVEDVQLLAQKSKAEKLVYFHHDPDRDDESINAIVRTGRESDIAAYDGLELII